MLAMTLESFVVIVYASNIPDNIRRVEMELLYGIFIFTTFVIPGLILLLDDGNFSRKDG